MLPKLSLILALSLPLAAVAQDPPPPAADGYVTRADASSFDINGFRILITPKTGAGLKANSFVSVGNAHELAPYLGERATVYGNRNDKAHTIQADKILLDPQAFGDVSGDGMIDWPSPPPRRTASSAPTATRFSSPPKPRPPSPHPSPRPPPSPPTNGSSSTASSAPTE